MKKLILIAACTLSVLSASAQEPQVSEQQQSENGTYSVYEDPNEYKENLSQVKKSYRASSYTSIRAGLSIFKFSGGGSSSDNLLGYNVGVYEGIPVFKNIVFTEFGISLIQKGGKSSYGSYESKSNPNYLEISVKVPVMYHFTKSIAGQVDFGIFYDQGIFGKTKTSYNGKEEDKSNFFDSKTDNRSSDFGFSFGAGFTFSDDIYLGFDYELGLISVSKGGSVKNRGFCINIGWNI